jgi:hypothetical protein
MPQWSNPAALNGTDATGILGHLHHLPLVQAAPAAVTSLKQQPEAGNTCYYSAPAQAYVPCITCAGCQCHNQAGVAVATQAILQQVCQTAGPAGSTNTHAMHACLRASWHSWACHCPGKPAMQHNSTAVHNIV